MGGKILEFSADKCYDAGKEEGRTEGRTEGEQRLASLVKALIANGRADEVARAASDAEYRASLY